MKTRQILSLVLGIASAALTATTWAAPHGGGDGGGGGHFGGGGGFHSGARGLGGYPGSGRPSYYYSRGMGFGGARSASQARMPLSRPHVFNGPDRSTTHQIVNTHAVAGNAAGSMAHSSRTFPRPTFNGHIAERHPGGSWHADWDRRHAHFDHHRFFVFDDGEWLGLDPGLFPWDYYPYYTYDYYPYDYYPGYYADVEPYYYNEGVYSETPMSDPTVTAVQTTLNQLGYYNGPIDGIYGQSTRDAVAKYQIDKNLEVTGSLSAQTLQSFGLPQPSAS